jgi:hypothetical protein
MDPPTWAILLPEICKGLWYYIAAVAKTLFALLRPDQTNRAVEHVLPAQTLTKRSHPKPSMHQSPRTAAHPMVKYPQRTKEEASSFGFAAGLSRTGLVSSHFLPSLRSPSVLTRLEPSSAGLAIDARSLCSLAS